MSPAEKPKSFSYQARDSAGRLVAGTLKASDERAVAASLSRSGYLPVRIEPAGALGGWSLDLLWKRRQIDRQEVLILMRELAALLRAGIPLATSLENAIQQTQSLLLRKVIGDVAERVQGGTSLSDAMAGHPDVFPELFISMVRVGEVAGILDQVLDRLAQLGTQELEMRSRVRSALVYPIVLISFALLVVNGLLVGVLPKFISVFQASKVALPWPTRLLLGVSWFLRRFWWLLGAGIGFGFLGWRRYYASPQGRWNTDQRLLRLPLVGVLYRKIMIARVTRTLGAMLRTGVPLLEALEVAGKTVPNVVLQRTLQRTRQAAAEGKSLTEIWTASGLFPPLVLQLVSVGERSGQLDAMLTEVASFYDPEIELTTRNLTTLLEPVLLMVMGLLVGFITLSVLLPIFQLIHVFRK